MGNEVEEAVVEAADELISKGEEFIEKAKSKMAEREASKKAEEEEPEEYLLDNIIQNTGSILRGTVMLPFKAVGKVGRAVDNLTPDMWPDMENIDQTVTSLRLAAYSLTLFAGFGSVYFASRSVRELVQWRRFYRYRSLAKQVRQAQLTALAEAKKGGKGL